MNLMKKFFFAIALFTLALGCNTSKQSGASGNQNPLDKQAHRGGRGLMPENTIPAMLNAIKLNVTTLELDLVISKDKKVVVSHDPYFNENITTTPEGNFLTKEDAATRLLYNMNYDSIRKYDVGLKPHPDFSRQEKRAAHKPLLLDLIDATEAAASKRGKTMLYNIEIKSKQASDGKKHPPVEEFVDLAMAEINLKGITNRTTIQSFDFRALQVIHRKYPLVKTSLLIESFDKRSLTEQLYQLDFIPTYYSPHFTLVTPALIQQCHEKNIKVIPWTVNRIEDINKQIQLDVDGIITDYPDLFKQIK
jgi:glycerophosphoryl diester phosphodiesterase